MAESPAPRNRPVKVGIVLPDVEGEYGGATPRWSDIRQLARMAEDLGFDSVWNADHLLFAHPGRERRGTWECWSILAALAATTSRVEFGALVSCTGYRNPALLAKIASTVDEISGGRLVLGLGAGWHQAEYESFGYPFDHRVSRFEDAITIVHGLLREGYVDYTGAYSRAEACELRPRGPRPAGPPIVIGSTSPRMLGLLAKYGDIWNAWDRRTVADVLADRAKVDAAMELAGRDPATVERWITILVNSPAATGRPSEAAASGIDMREPEELAHHILSYAEAGVDHVQIMQDPNTPAGLEWTARALEIVDQG